MNNVGAARDGRHEAIDMWFFWCFNDSKHRGADWGE